ncbi:MAG: LemA family protein [Patescibacteria group bacterium]
MDLQYIVYLIVGLIITWAVWTYNIFIRLHYRVKEALADIDVQLKRRYDLIPNLIETVKGYMAHEKGVLEKVTEARAHVVTGQNPLARAESENALSMTLKTLFAVSENYPDLKANANFLDLQRELADTENKIQAARRFYNTNVLQLNSKVESFPSNLMAKVFSFGKEKFFEVESAVEREVIKVKF